MHNLPKITVITPSFNQANFLERTILSVLNQNYRNLEYIIVDGGSTDGSIEIIKKYQHLLAWWVSEKDDGQAAAINKGLRRATGKWVGWQNSDDIYFRNTFHDLVVEAKKKPKVGLITADMMLIDESDNFIRDVRYVKPTYKSVLAEGMVLCNQSAFWLNDLHKKIGFLNENYQYSFDFDWFLRLLRNTDAGHVPRIWGGFRKYKNTKTYLNKDNFTQENITIVNKFKVSSWEKNFFRVRRFFLLLLNFQFRYVLRGLVIFFINLKIK